MEKRIVDRSFARIKTHNGNLTLQMVNHNFQSFMMFPEPLISIYRNPNWFVRVKRRNGIRSKEFGYHPGEIFGIMKGVQIQGDPYVELNLYFGPADKSMAITEACSEPLNAIGKRRFLFPEEEFSRVVDSIEAMYEQSSQFSAFSIGADVVVLDNQDFL
jgi:hypothetical protein